MAAGVVVASVFALVWIVRSSQLFQSCVKANYDNHASQPMEEGIRSFFRIHWWCTGVFIDGNGASITALSGVVLTISTIALWLATRKAANTAARALTDLERAHVFAEITNTGIEIAGRSLGQPSARLGVIEISFFNVGRTPAFLTYLKWGTFAVPGHDAPPPVDSRIDRGRELPVGVVVANDRTYSERENLFGKFRMDSRHLIVTRQESVWCFGFVRYRDILNEHHVTGFCFAYDASHDTFVQRGDGRYNYSRDEQPEDIPSAPPAA
ncbi:MAG TPA: hypothetical protein VHU87_03115 [Rhizomicrobium sp.]|jgi:hypothetical protein|nr:hypothetical protein [Rhizomicrobium sp.]